jgi:cytochrome c5
MSILSKRYASAALLLGALAIPLFAAGCEGEDLGDCPTNSATQQARGAQVITNKCTTCHSSKLAGAERGGAPDDLNYDDSTKVQEEAELMYGETTEGVMPPSGKLSAAELEDLRVYLACLGK